MMKMDKAEYIEQSNKVLEEINSMEQKKIALMAQELKDKRLKKLTNTRRKEGT